MPLTLRPDVLPVSVVIATLGGRDLEATLVRLRSGSRVPEEIMLCIPQGIVPEARFQEDDCLHVLWTSCRGQVAQRALGLAQVRNPFVLQMDDDVMLSPTALEQLFDVCSDATQPMAVAPLFKLCETGQYLTRYRSNLKGFLQSLSATVIGAAPWGARRMGRIDRSGIPYAVDPDYCNAPLVETEWLPGGCVLCRREHLVCENYYPFPGKAYSEDVIHSVLWRQRGVRLWVAPHIECCTHVVPMPATSSGILADYRARAHLISLNGGSLLRCRIWFALFVVRQRLAGLLGRRA